MFGRTVSLRLGFTLLFAALLITLGVPRHAEAGWFDDLKESAGKTWDAYGAPLVADASAAVGEAVDDTVAWWNAQQETPADQQLTAGEGTAKTLTVLAQAGAGSVEIIGGAALGALTAITAGGSALVGWATDGKYEIAAEHLKTARDISLGLMIQGMDSLDDGAGNLVQVTRAATGKYLLPGYGEDAKDFVTWIDETPQTYRNAEGAGRYLSEVVAPIAYEIGEEYIRSVPQQIDDIWEDIPDDERLSVGEGVEVGLDATLQGVTGAVETVAGLGLGALTMIAAGASELVGGATSGAYQLPEEWIDWGADTSAALAAHGWEHIEDSGRNFLEVGRASTGQYFLPDVTSDPRDLGEWIDAMPQTWANADAAGEAFVDEYGPAIGELGTGTAEVAVGTVELGVGGVVGTLGIATAAVSEAVGAGIGAFGGDPNYFDATADHYWAIGLTYVQNGVHSYREGGGNILNATRDVTGLDQLLPGMGEDNQGLYEWQATYDARSWENYAQAHADIDALRATLSALTGSVIDCL